jgi:hypothetical protein
MTNSNDNQVEDFGPLEKIILKNRIFDLKMKELFEEPSTYEDELEDI